MREHFLLTDGPTLTCMIQARTPKRAKELIQLGISQKADAFGLQLEQLEHQYHKKEVYQSLLELMEDRPAYITNYAYGINERVPYEELANELLEIAECGAKLIDIQGDLFCPSENQITYDTEAIQKQKQLIRQIHLLGSEVLISSHTFRYMTYETVEKIAQDQFDRGADIAKIVTSADNESERDDSIQILLKLKSRFEKPCLFLCAGSENYLHRRIGPFLSGGMFLCVAEYDELATKAQPRLRDAVMLRNLLNQK